jgi:hypothetical protein
MTYTQMRGTASKPVFRELWYSRAGRQALRTRYSSGYCGAVSVSLAAAPLLAASRARGGFGFVPLAFLGVRRGFFGFAGSGTAPRLRISTDTPSTVNVVGAPVARVS